MESTVAHDVFGELEIEVDGDTLHLNGTVAVGSGNTRLHITGRADQAVEEIVGLAAAAHAIFAAHEDELRASAVRAVVTQDQLADIAEEVGEELTMDDVIDGYASIMIINYFTQENEVSIYFEDGEGLIGMDVTRCSDLRFSDVSGGFDG